MILVGVVEFEKCSKCSKQCFKHSHLEDCTAVKKLYLRYYGGKQEIVDFALLVVVYVFHSICCEYGFTTSCEEPVSYGA